MSTPYRVPILDEFDWQVAVLSRATSPPGGPAKGNRYIIIATATGAWATYENYVTYYTGSTWKFVQPSEGWMAYVKDEDSYYTYTGSIWKKSIHKNSGAIDEMFVEVMG